MPLRLFSSIMPIIPVGPRNASISSVVVPINTRTSVPAPARTLELIVTQTQ